MRNFDSAVWDREKQNYVLSSTCANFTLNSATKLPLLSTGNKHLAEVSHLDPVRGISLRADDPRANDSHTVKWKRKHLLGEALSAVREAIRDSEAGSPHPASPRRLRSPTSNAGIHVRSAVALVDRGQRLPRSSLGYFGLFFEGTPGPKSGGLGDSFWRRLRPSVVRTRPLPRREYCGAGRRFFHYQHFNT